jgi:GMP synthase-like glutamine amidotransferase
MNRVKNEKKNLTTAIQEKKKKIFKICFSHEYSFKVCGGKDWDSLFLFDSFLRP